MSQRRGACRLYGTPQGCRFGNKCKYSHDRGTTPPTRGGGPSTLARSRSQTPASPSASPRSPASLAASGVPRNTCQFFWTTGDCSRGFECSFRHVRQTTPAGPAPAAAESGAAVVDQEDSSPDFFSPEGLAIGAGSVRDQRHSFNPGEVHNHLKDFTKDNYRFDSPAQVQGFVRVLASVNDRNKSWVSLIYSGLLECGS